jgi:SagB-type dehydrogenase family enzyme
LTINRAAFRGGTHFPIFPDGPYTGLIRPFWIFQGVSGFDNGIWYYHPPADKWAMLERGEHRMDSAYLCREQPLAADAGAVCFLCANLAHVMSHIGPDAYRLAHLEAGVVVQRLYISSNSLGVGCAPIAEFYDDEIRKFLGLDRTGWEIIHAAAIGISTDVRVEDQSDVDDVETLDESDVWEG